MPVQIDKQSMIELADIVAKAVVVALKDSKVIGQADEVVHKKQEKTAYQKTEQLLFNYLGFKKIVEERRQEIEEIRKYGVPQSCAVKEYVDKGGTVQGIVLPEESVEAAVCRIQASVHDTVQVISMIDKAMQSLKGDMYYEILPMRYFEGRTLEDIGIHFNCDHSTISRNRSRLVRELAMRLFPDEVVNEFIK
jgi:DNA-directed RNA polymerase specialized sigma subunit